MSEEERKSYPILGNAILWSSNSNEPALAEPQDEHDDLPFQNTIDSNYLKPYLKDFDGFRNAIKKDK